MVRIVFSVLKRRRQTLTTVRIVSDDLLIGIKSQCLLDGVAGKKKFMANVTTRVEAIQNTQKIKLEAS